jgi:hypothetical protein
LVAQEVTTLATVPRQPQKLHDSPENLLVAQVAQDGRALMCLSNRLSCHDRACHAIASAGECAAAAAAAAAAGSRAGAGSLSLLRTWNYVAERQRILMGLRR